jgi:phosphonoacetaldehyde hydrolase
MILKYKGVIFDLSGVLVDFGVKVPMLAMVQAFHLNNIFVSDNLLRFGIGKPLSPYIKSLCYIYNNQHNYKKIENDFKKSLIALSKNNFNSPITGSVELLHKLKQNNIKIGLMTVYDRKYLDLIKSQLDNDGIIYDSIMCSDDHIKSRPDPWQLLHLTERLNVNPNDCIKIGESCLNICETRNANFNNIQVIDSSSDMNIDEQELDDMTEKMKQIKREDIILKLGILCPPKVIIRTIQDINNII